MFFTFYPTPVATGTRARRTRACVSMRATLLGAGMAPANVHVALQQVYAAIVAGRCRNALLGGR